MTEIEMQYDKLQTKIALTNGRDCDKYDYFIATFCGVVCGVIDVVFVGKPNRNGDVDSVLGKWTDAQSEKLLSKIADTKIAKDMKVYQTLKDSGLKGEKLRDALEQDGIPRNFSSKGYDTLSKKIAYLENKYRVGYDQSTGDEFISKVSGLSPCNHHLKGLAHAPDILGLLCAIIDQFTGETTLFQDGQLISKRIVLGCTPK